MKPPRAKIVKMHKLLDEALSLWPDVKRWMQATDIDHPERPSPAWALDDELQWTVAGVRHLRHEVETKP